MATVHPGTASPAPASSTGALPDHAQTVTCPFCKTAASCPLVPDSALQQFPCPSCAENLIVLNPEARPTDEDMVAPHSDDTTGSPDMSRRMAGIAVAVLACLLNYALLSGVAYWMFNQIKATHDPYNIDELMLSPLILRSNGWTALHLAAARGDVATTTVLLAETDPIDRRNGSGRTALYEASKRGQTPVVALLLQHGANPNAKTKQGYTPLLAAAERGHADTIAVLLSNRADLRATCTCGDSALHRAVRQGHLAAAQALLEHGIPVNQKTHGQTALEIAQLDEDDDLIHLLRTHGGKEFSQAKAHREKGMAFQKLGQIDKALFAYAETLNLDPDDPIAYYDRGTALIQKEALDEALIAFHAAIDLDPTFLDAYGAATQIHMQRHQWDQALALWDRYLVRQPQNGRAHFERSIIRRAKGDTQGFMHDLQQACASGHQPAC
ncbi:MAG: ankyrin repeat domain-containing protein [Nitrospira defluvii]|nr:ankyrin repeat domain-containing protein [Nitrospira defluvii]